MALELRNHTEVLKLRQADDQKRFIDGYAAVFNKPTIIWDFEEIIAPGAFKRAINEKQDVRALFNHDPNYPLGRTKHGTLVLREDSTGLWTETSLSTTNPTALSVYDFIQRGDVDGMSFAFTVRKQEWEFQELGSEQLDRRIITEIGVMYDVGPVTYPAYEQTSIKIRSDAKKLHEEARSRYDEKRSSVKVQVPVGFNLVYRECRSAGDLWVPEEVTDKNGGTYNEFRKDDFFTTVTTAGDLPGESKKEVLIEAEADEKTKENTDPTITPQTEASGEAPPEAGSASEEVVVSEGAGTPSSVEVESFAAENEAIAREIGIKLKIGKRGGIA